MAGTSAVWSGREPVPLAGGCAEIAAAVATGRSCDVAAVAEAAADVAAGC